MDLTEPSVMAKEKICFESNLVLRRHRRHNKALGEDVGDVVGSGSVCRSCDEVIVCGEGAIAIPRWQDGSICQVR